MSWARDFYARQAQWGHLYTGPILPSHRRRAEQVAAGLGDPPARVLELGAGGGQFAVALAAQGYSVVAVELVPALARHIRRLAAQHPDVEVEVIEGDFLEIDLPAHHFDGLCYWDGFGVGSDDEQRRLLRRIARWLKRSGRAWIEVFTPWHAARLAGLRQRVGEAWREYGFDAEGSRWLDRWWRPGHEAEHITQSLRCYTPADLRLLLEGTGLALVELWPGGKVDLRRGRYLPRVPLAQAMSYTAILRPTG